MAASIGASTASVGSSGVLSSASVCPLRADLARARVRRSQDVSLYEASMRTADDAAVRNGLVVMAVLLVLAGLLVAAALHFVR